MGKVKLTQDVIDNILEIVALGHSLASACRKHSVMSSAFIWRVGESPELAERYARARDAGIDAQADEMHDLESRVLSGEIDHAAYRAAMDARKWRMARQSPRRYGDRVQQEISGGDTPVNIQFTWEDN